MSKRVSASKYWLARLCTWAFRDDAVWVNTPSYSSRYGTAFHTSAHRILEGAQTPGEAAYGIVTKCELTPRQAEKLDETLRKCWGTIERFRDQGWTGEKAHYFHPLLGTAGDCEDDGSHTYPTAPAGAFAGTVDLRLILPDKHESAHVADYKTGWYQEHPKDSDQMRLLGLALARQYKLPGIATSILRVRPDSGIAWLTHPLSGAELDDIEAETRRVYLALKDPKPYPGAHCKRCPARETCTYAEAA